jgi:hypothetical protein
MVPRSHRAGWDAEAFGYLLDAHRIEARHGPDGSACRGARTKGHALNLPQIRHSRLHSGASLDYNERMAQTTRTDIDWYYIVATDEAIFDRADVIDDLLTAEPQTASAIGRQAGMSTSLARITLDWMAQEQFAMATGNGAWRRYSKR